MASIPISTRFLPSVTPSRIITGGLPRLGATEVLFDTLQKLLAGESHRSGPVEPPTSDVFGRGAPGIHAHRLDLRAVQLQLRPKGVSESADGELGRIVSRQCEIGSPSNTLEGQLLPDTVGRTRNHNTAVSEGLHDDLGLQAG
jgi:hypothetical protein